MHRPNCKATNASVLSRHFKQSFYRQLLNSGDPLQWRCRNKDLVVVLWSLQTNRNKLKGSKDFNWNNIGLASLWFVWFCIAGTQDSGWFLADLLSGHVSTLILMRKCDSKYREIFFNRAEHFRAVKYNKSVFASSCFKMSCLPFIEILNVDISYRQNLWREGESEKQPTVVGSLK